MKKLIRLSLVLYLSALFAPLAHELLADGVEEGACERCEALAFSGPVLRARCDESRPCENSEHHHHHRHHVHGQCPVCQQSKVAGLQASRSPFDAALKAAEVPPPARAEGSHRRRELCLNLARAPPRIS